MCKVDQIPGYWSNPKDTLHKRGRDAPDVPLHGIIKQLLEYLGTLKALQHAENKIETKYSIKKDDTGLWPVDDMKKAWGKTLRMNCLHENKRTLWSIVIIMQMVKQNQRSSQHPDTPKSRIKKPQMSVGKTSKKEDRKKEDRKKHKDQDSKEEDLKTKNIEKGSEGILIPLNMFPSTVQQQQNPDDIHRLKLIAGEPKFNKELNELNKTSHVGQYDNTTNNAAWVFEILNNDTMKGPALQSTFRLDYSTHRENRAPKSLKTYKGTGYDRGHLAAAANHKWCQEARDDTNLLSNIAPQHRDLNRKKWKKLEHLCRLYVKHPDYSKAYIYTGPLYHTKKDITEEEKKEIEKIRQDFWSKYEKDLPTYFFKVIILEKKDGERILKCYEMPNIEEKKEEEGEEEEEEEEEEKEEEEAIPIAAITNKIQSIEEELSDYSTNIGYIERVSKLTFTKKIQKEKNSVTVTVNFRADEKKFSTNVEVITI